MRIASDALEITAAPDDSYVVVAPGGCAHSHRAGGVLSTPREPLPRFQSQSSTA
jgi:hypothetical protein